MARLGLIYGVLKKAHKLTVKQRRSECRLARYVGQAFRLSDDEFYGNYRITKGLFEDIFAELQPLIPIPKRRSDIIPKYKVLVTLSFYATGSYQRLIGNSYVTVMSQQSVSRAIRQVTNALNHPSIRDKWIKFPQTFEERNVIKRRFYEKFNIPGVLGCIDGTHVAIIRPKENEERFFNRKHFHSRNVLVISDADLNILSVDSSFGGASHDSFIWNQNPVKAHLITLNGSGENVYLLGDSGYAQREYLMTPIIDAPAGSPEEHYTEIHCSARSTVERTVGLLKNRWRCLLRHRVLHYDPFTASKIINACCVLHNMCNQILSNEAPMPHGSHMEPDEDTLGAELEEQNFHTNRSLELRVGIQMRTRLVEQLWATRLHNN